MIDAFLPDKLMKKMLQKIGGCNSCRFRGTCCQSKAVPISINKNEEQSKSKNRNRKTMGRASLRGQTEHLSSHVIH